jgi:hypothetical protein
MAPKLRRLTLAFDGNSGEADNVSSFVRATALSRYIFHAVDIPAEDFRGERE